MNILYLGSHAILEYDQTKLWTDLGHDVFSIGAYSDPHHPGVDMRPAIPEAPVFADLIGLVHESRKRHEGQSTDYPVIDWAKYDLHSDLIAWADTVIIDCFPETWIPANWSRLKGKRTIWRTIGQSNPDVERFMSKYRREGLEIVRYSPREKYAFERAGAFAGEDAVIRFGKSPQDWSGWNGSDGVVGNITQNMVTRADHCGLDRWLAATDGLPVRPAGPGSEALRGGVGVLDYEAMRKYLRDVRVYLYTGTMPASYTLGLIEAMMTGVPVLRSEWRTRRTTTDPAWLDELWEDDIFPRHGYDVSILPRLLRDLLENVPDAAQQSKENRARAVELFGTETIGTQWADVLGRVAVAA
jgi:glycosyltransferase involved in cell wall biosynthesis